MSIGSGTAPPVLLDSLPEPVLVGPLVALEDGFGRLPATEFTEHLEGQVHEVGGELHYINPRLSSVVYQ